MCLYLRMCTYKSKHKVKLKNFRITCGQSVIRFMIYAHQIKIHYSFYCSLDAQSYHMYLMKHPHFFLTCEWKLLNFKKQRSNTWIVTSRQFVIYILYQMYFAWLSLWNVFGYNRQIYCHVVFGSFQTSHSFIVENLFPEQLARTYQIHLRSV